MWKETERRQKYEWGILLLCDYAPRSRCSSMKEEETTIDTVIVDELIEQVEPRDGVNMVDIDTIIKYFLDSISHYWDCMECKCWTAKDGGRKKTYAMMHGLANVDSKISSFCRFFMVRKCYLSQKESLKCYTIMSTLSDFLFANNYIDDTCTKTVEVALFKCCNFNAEKITKALKDLRDGGGYWKALAKVQDSNEDELPARWMETIAGDDEPMP
jgi:hypothetical protein